MTSVILSMSNGALFHLLNAFLAMTISDILCTLLLTLFVSSASASVFSRALLSVRPQHLI